MPVLAKLSLATYEKLGEQTLDELVDWLNQVGDTLRDEWRWRRELDVSRLEIKVDQALAALARIEAALTRRT